MSSSSIRRVAALAATLLVTAQIIMLQIPGGGSEAQAAASELAPFQRVWSRTDEPIAAGKVARTWMWGPAAVS
ncbi:MAG TPA: peptidase S8, partial [Chloroflexi bacterium]|nr:peptidase S8 [Chloroflexota bacterium]